MEDGDIGAGIWVILGLYLACVLGIGVYSFVHRKKRRAEAQCDSLEDHYIAGGTLGVVVLSFTIFASLFSGYTVVGVPADAYREGFRAMRWIPAILWVVLGNMIISPRLMKLSKSRRYVSPVDFLNDRFRSVSMRAVVSVLMIAPMIGYMTAQFSAMGSTVNSLSDNAIPKLAGAIALGFVILMYEGLGGFHSVSLTDCAQGAILSFGFLGMFIVQKVIFGGLPEIVKTIAETSTDISHVPSTLQSWTWVMWTLPFLGFPLYPHLLARTLAAKDARTYRYGLFMIITAAFVVMTSSIMTGLSGRSVFPGLDAEDIPGIFGKTMRAVLAENNFFYFMGSMIFAAAVAALMSTADSGLMGVSVIVAMDVFKPLYPNARNRDTKIIGGITSVITTTIAILLSNLNITLTALIALQNTCIFQILPSYLLGMYTKTARSGPLTSGMVAGLIMAILVQTNALASSETLPTVTAGVLGFAVNICVVIIGHVYLYKFKGSNLPSEMEQKSESFRFKTSIPAHLIGFFVTPSKEELADPVLREQARADGHMEPIHNPVLPVAAFVLLILTAPIMLEEGPDGVSNGMPTWAILSMQTCVAAALVMAYSMYWSWDIENPEIVKANAKNLALQDYELEPKLKRRNLSTKSLESGRDSVDAEAS